MRVPRQIRDPSQALVADCAGQSLIEIALVMPLLTLLLAYAIDFGYFFLAAANITSAARNAAQYSIMGFSSPSQSAVPDAGPISTPSSVAALAMADMQGLLSASVSTTVQVCSKSVGTSGNLAVCENFGPNTTTYVPAADPEAPTFLLQRVDVTYTVQPPVPLSFFKVSLLPNLNFHRQVSMRTID